MLKLPHKVGIVQIVDGVFVPNSTYEAELSLQKEKASPTKHFDSDKSFGAMAILMQAAKRSFLLADLTAIYGHEQVSMAANQIIKNTTAHHRFKAFTDSVAVLRDLPESIDSPRLSEHCNAFGREVGRINQLFRRRTVRMPDEEYLSFDSTRISSEAKGLSDVRKGISKKGGYEKQIGLAILYGHASGAPVMYRRFSGNVPDIKTLHDLLNRWDDLDIDKHVSVVFDRGYCSCENVRLLLQHRHRFIMAAMTDHAYIRQVIEDHMPAFWDASNNVHGFNVSGICCRTPVPSKSSADARLSVWVYCFYSLSLAHTEQQQFFSDLEDFEEQWSRGLANEDCSLLKFYETPQSSPGACTLVRNHDAINNKTRYMGFFAMLSDRRRALDDVLTVYRTRDCIEKCFRRIKTDIGLNTTRAHSDGTVNARLLISFIAAAMVSWIVTSMQAPVTVGRKTFRPLSDEFSFMQLLDEVAQIRLYGTCRGKNWLGEILVKHRQIFDRLGISDALDDLATYK